MAAIRDRARGVGGFTLIELLVVILIVGILAAIAIPTFLTQRNKAYAAQAEEFARSIASALEVYASQNSGQYEGADLAALNQIEPTIPANGKRQGLVASVSVEPAAYVVSVEVTKLTVGKRHPTFEIRREATGESLYSCRPPATTVGCPPTGVW